MGEHVIEVIKILSFNAETKELSTMATTQPERGPNNIKPVVINSSLMPVFCILKKANIKLNVNNRLRIIKY